MRLARFQSLGLRSVLIVLIGTLSLSAQEAVVKGSGGTASQPPAASAPIPKRTYNPARRVPDYFGQLGLTPEQKEAVYEIRGKHYAKINELQQEITRLQASMLAECEGVLTDLQKQRLHERRQLAAETRRGSHAVRIAKDAPKTATP
ncbi:hypothetical protein [Singulisphaera sp. PoT]|uniref:hypothetical protein n=1 Tax=Singulisphaera sp. PoT TaxID=3411797 RepID=UPI003BF4D096